MNKQELTRLQHNFEDCIKQFSLLEKSKSSETAIASIMVGVLGTACMAILMKISMLTGPRAKIIKVAIIFPKW